LNSIQIFAYGLRNPYKLSWDSKHKELWVGDVGETRIEEIDFISAGKDYGWPLFEGTKCFSSPDCASTVGSNYEGPVVTHPHSCDGTGCLSADAIIGGHWYYGNRVPLLQDKYVYADWSTGSLYALRAPDRNRPHDNPSVQRVVPNFSPKLKNQFNPSVFAKDPDGELMVSNWWTPQIWKISEEVDQRETTTSAYALNEGEEIMPRDWFGVVDETFEDDLNDTTGGGASPARR
jgi:glucose/arabinose dehydrogenase